VVVPCRDEAGTIDEIVERVPDMGRATEIIFVEGHSTDGTRGAIERAISAYPERDLKLQVQTGKGKGNAVREGFERASGDMLMILDADLTVAPEDLPKFYEVIATGHAEIANGSRLVYDIEPGAMQFLNVVGNKLFSVIFSYLIGQPIKDTLCGTKVLLRSDYETIAQGRSWFGDFDPFGDFDLLLGGGRLSLKIADIPVRYRRRTYGATSISRFRHGLLLARMSVVGFRTLKMRSSVPS
jgi:glycosyltransferase involved in cell wall biosynthesis